MKITVSCCLCERQENYEVSTAPGWSDENADIETALCPDHANIQEWQENQCPGCAGGWGECPLWQAFAYSHNSRTKPLGEDEFSQIERGICPRRVNGTFVAGWDGVVRSTDISSRAPNAAGVALAAAIRSYRERYLIAAQEPRHGRD